MTEPRSRMVYTGVVGMTAARSWHLVAVDVLTRAWANALPRFLLWCGLAEDIWETFSD